MAERLLETISRFKGNYPDIPLPDDIDPKEFGGEFFTLPIGEIGAKSVNQDPPRIYREPAIKKLVKLVNETRPLGWWGHPDLIERSKTAPAIQWLAGVVDGDGVAWGKLVPLTESARTFLTTARKTKSRVGNSLYGEGTFEGSNVVDLSLGYIDLITDPSWVGVPAAAGVPQITSEMAKGGTPVPPEEQNNVLIQELRTDRDTARARISELESQLNGFKSAHDQVEAARAYIKEMADVYTNAGITINASGPDLMMCLKEMTAKLQALQMDQLQQRLDMVVMEALPQPKSGTESEAAKALREMVRSLLGEPKDEAAARTKIQEILAQPHMVALRKAVVVEAAGPSVITGGNGSTSGNGWKDDVAKQAEEDAKKRIR